MDTQLISWNVNGMRAVQKKGFLDWFQTASPGILCIQETKAHPDQLDNELLHVSGYKVWFSSAEKKGYSGVAVYSKEEPLSVSKGFGIPRFDSEGRILRLDFEKFILFNIYFPNGKASRERLQYKMDFYAAFLEITHALHAEGKRIVVCGDVNTAHKEIDLSRPRENEGTSGFLPEERAWIDDFLASGFLDSFREFTPEGEHFTWWDYKTRARERNIGWRIDYFFVSQTLKPALKDAFILKDVMGSDHCPLGITLSF